MGAKNKPYNMHENAPRNVNVNLSYGEAKDKPAKGVKKRSKRFSGRAKVQHKGWKAGVGYGTEGSEVEHPYGSSTFRDKLISAELGIPLSEYIDLEAHAARQSGKGKYESIWGHTGQFGPKPTWSGGAGLHGRSKDDRFNWSLTGATDPYETKGMARATLRFNKGGKVTRKNKKKK